MIKVKVNPEPLSQFGKAEPINLVEIPPCPFCGFDRVEPKKEYDIVGRSVWECCRCGQEFEVEY